MNKIIEYNNLISKNAEAMGGVYTFSDLAVILATQHRSLLPRRIHQLIEAGVLFRFAKGFYVRESFDFEQLAQRMYPTSYLSFESVLAERLVIASVPLKKLSVICPGQGRHATIASGEYRLEKAYIKPSYFFGFSQSAGVCKADVEKALIDVLYFYVKGRRTIFDIYSDINWDRIDQKKLMIYLDRYKNPKFVAMVRELCR